MVKSTRKMQNIVRRDLKLLEEDLSFQKGERELRNLRVPGVKGKGRVASKPQERECKRLNGPFKQSPERRDSKPLRQNKWRRKPLGEFGYP